MKRKEFDYYIFIDYSENLIGYNIIEREKVPELLLRISRFRHYRSSRDRKIYLKNAWKTISRENIKSYFLRFKIKEKNKNMEIYLDVFEFLKKHDNCIVFISVDNHEYSNFRKMVDIINGEKIVVKKESELREGTAEYQMSLVLDTMLNIERLRRNG